MNGLFNLYLTMYQYGVTPGTATPLKSFGSNHAGFAARCNLGNSGWLERFYFFTPAGSREEARAIAGNLGGTGEYANIIKVHDNLGILLHGWVFDIQPDGRYLRYECVGDRRHLRNAKFDTDLDNTTNVSDAFPSILSVIPQVHVSATNIDSNTTDIGAFHVEEVTEGDGYFPEDALPELRDMGNTAYDTFDIWFEARENLRGMDSQLSTFYYQKRDRTRTYADWYVPYDWLVPGRGLGQGDIFNYASSVIVHYGRVVGTHDGPENFMHFIDSSENFPALGVSIGDTIVNKTKSTAAGYTISGWVSGFGRDGSEIATRLNDPGGSVVGFSVGDEAEFILKSRLGEAASTATGTETFYAKPLEVEAPAVNNVQAGQLANELALTLSKATFTRPFSIGSGLIRDAAGGEYPATRLLKRPSHMIILGDSPSIRSLSLDITAQRGLFTLALDYTHDDMVMSVTPNMAGDRLDSVLYRAGLVGGEDVNSGGRDVANSYTRNGHLLAWYNGQAASFPWWADRPDDIFDPKHRPENYPWGYPSI